MITMRKKREVKVDYNKWEPFDGSQKHKNIIIADTLEAIEDVLLFRLSNYFLKFSEEYKRQHPNEPFTNDWYEFVEYGTTNRLRIILQRSGFKRDSTEYIRKMLIRMYEELRTILSCLKRHYWSVQMNW